MRCRACITGSYAWELRKLACSFTPDVHLHPLAACLCVLILRCAVPRQADLVGPMPFCSAHGSWQHSPCVEPAAVLPCLHVNPVTTLQSCIALANL